MSTGAEFVSVTSKKLMGFDDFGSRFLDYLRESIRVSTEQTFTAGGVFEAKLAMAADGNDNIQITGTSLATDGDGNMLDIANAEVKDQIQFENASGADYFVALRAALIPKGIVVNPRTGRPEYVTREEEIGVLGTPDLVVDNGNSTITFTVDSVTEAGITNAGRKVRVYLKSPAADAQTESIALETLTVVFAGGFNKVTTAADLGQGTISTTASDYEVVLIGPEIKRNTDLRLDTSVAYVGFVTGVGAGSPPVAFDTVEQVLINTSLSAIEDITRIASNGHLKIDVKSFAGESDEDQIRVRNPAGSIVFKVDEDGQLQADRGTFIDDFQTPTTQTQLVSRHAQNAVVARGHITGVGGAKAVTGEHWNVDTITNSGVGLYLINLDEDIDIDCSVVITIEDLASGFVINAGVVIGGASIAVRTTDLSGAFADRDFTFVAIGSPETLP